ncbi:Histidine ammonia-lyase [Serratia quinivorans]|uniref:HAL/PAL/TAL family ammonia-lyase n=1 Tax=Serratia quinivorans TaxID=137545 RepID=UPI00217C6F50|nr:aromatic amino acid ammonia-lyase [Serratia quinivorans]CAI0700108.1 Histidine ammonia-lyase [Serratia quinivorans]CAI0866630.1 Histidine ammonia-lyase [Serratia quinivorans]CAI0870015.1 Histidine ammonia-lyase [Serratia quinivorans]CAI1201416.1 Histidine ammonia-lyase [Serratia quinivorans]CAI1633709.1 Histidine ammonia-lyase [Serratia quinivorans]
MPGKFALSLLAALTFGYSQLGVATVTLDGHSITPQMIANVADGEAVAVAPVAINRVTLSHQVLIEAAQNGLKIYGLTVGVGLNKDRPMVDVHGKLTQEVIDASKKFNVGLLHAHSGGIGEPMSIRVARATLVTRLNGLLSGGGGVQPAIVDAYVAFLNKGITPVIPAGGSVGEGDITVISHIGLAMIGEGEVYYQGNKMAAMAALQSSQTAAITPYAKDALAILSSNAYSAASGALVLDSLAHLMQVNTLTYALSLQALNGNVSPFLANTLALRPYPEVAAMGKNLRELLVGSSLWQHDDSRPLQDPLSFRSGVYLLAELQRSYQSAYDQLLVQLNSSDDNPGVALGATPPSQRPQEAVGYVNEGKLQGAVLPSANFEPLPWVLAFEQLGLALAHNSLASAQQVVKLNNPAFTGLTRFLGTDHTVHAFGAMEKPVMMLAMRNKELAMPVSLDYFPVAGDIEDIATNAPSVVERVQQQVDNAYQLLGILLVHDAQAVDLRQQRHNGFTLSAPTAALYTAVRQRVPFIETDRPLAPDFAAAEQVLRQYGK